MKKTRFTERQILSVLQEMEAGILVTDLTRKHGVSSATIYNWRAKFGGMTESELKKLRQLEQENRRLWKNCERKINTSLQMVTVAFLALLLKRF